MKILVLISLFLAVNISAQDIQKKSELLLDIKGVKIDMPFEEVKNILDQFGQGCFQTVLKIEDENYIYGDRYYSCKRYRFFEENFNEGIVANFSNNKLVRLSLMGLHSDSRGHLKPIPEFLQALVNKFKVSIRFIKKQHEEFEITPIIDKDGSKITLYGRVRAYVDSVSFNKMTLSLESSYFDKMILERMAEQEKHELRNENLKLEKAKRDI